MQYTGIYKIQSKVKPERCYIGSAVNITTRWNEHLWKLKLNKHPNNKLQHHYNKYSLSDLVFTILLGCEKEDLIKTEQYFIDSYNPWFNICKIAGSSRGRIMPEEVKEKIRQKRKLQVNTNKGKKYHWDHPRQGLIWNKGTKGLQVAWNKGKKYHVNYKGHTVSEETKKKISETMIKNYALKRLNELDLITKN